MYKMLLFTLTFALMTTACQKAREAQFAAGSGENLFKTADYSGKTFDIQTGDPVAQDPAAQEDETVKISLESSEFQNVTYKVSNPLAEKLLGNTPINGRAHFRYKGLIKVTDTLTTVYKIAKPDDVSANEATYAEKQADGTLLIPLISIPVDGGFNVSLKKNEVGEITSVKEEKKQKSVAAAQFFKMDTTKAKAFEVAPKADLIPSSYFEGEWYFAETSNAGDTDAGPDAATKARMKKVKFLLGGDEIRMVDANLDPNLTEREAWHTIPMMVIEMERKAFKVVEQSQKEDLEAKLRARPFLKIDFASARTANSAESVKLGALKVTPNYLSFDLEDKNDVARTRTRSSFLRLKKGEALVDNGAGVAAPVVRDTIQAREFGMAAESDSGSGAGADGAAQPADPNAPENTAGGVKIEIIHDAK
jgi:hypothetical protein